ncbi:PilZ domain-containing protein [Microvirga sp. BT689]|uniref:PilZ domain-containing protein n=1 Tax=Microvirga arvi TaxID=2778731 RepID=UPI0019507BEF|nr:PilZ domain-containing protein [Microvirga arvi]MBM6584263.1 PilZ domain-containing protein [Microvirga arvi]
MEHRRSLRTRTILQGRVVFNNRFSLIECTVRDLSETGAQITFSHPVSLPSELELEIPKKGLSTRAKVMWSRGIHHGIMFLEATQDEARDDSPAAFAETMAPDKSSPQEGEIDGPAPTIQDVLEEARRRIAHIAGVPVETVRLKLEIEF